MQEVTGDSCNKDRVDLGALLSRQRFLRGVSHFFLPNTISLRLPIAASQECDLLKLVDHVFV